MFSGDCSKNLKSFLSHQIPHTTTPQTPAQSHSTVASIEFYTVGKGVRGDSFKVLGERLSGRPPYDVPKRTMRFGRCKIGVQNIGGAEIHRFVGTSFGYFCPLQIHRKTKKPCLNWYTKPFKNHHFFA